jgi:hypothetical protein
VVVFSCRHLYHRQCVLDAISGLHRPTGAHGSVSRREHPDWPVAELFCPACT